MNRLCLTCKAPINCYHGNAKYCINCRPQKKPIEHKEELPIKVEVAIKEFNKLERRARIGKKVEMLNEDSKKIVLNLLDKLLKGE